LEEKQMRLRIGIAVLMLATAINIYGQATPPMPPCRPQRVTAFHIERRLPFSGVLTTVPNQNPLILSFVPGLVSGTLEIRGQFLYQPQGRVILVTAFIIESDLPFPTSDQEREEYGTVVDKLTLGIKHISTSCSPVPSLMFVGTVTQNFPKPGDALYTGGWGVDLTGTPYSLSTGYTTPSNPNPPGSSSCANPYPKQPKLFNVTESLAGVGLGWAPCAVGTVTFEPEEHYEGH
jgi:hypothetical protein